MVLSQNALARAFMSRRAASREMRAPSKRDMTADTDLRLARYFSRVGGVLSWDVQMDDDRDAAAGARSTRT